MQGKGKILTENQVGLYERTRTRTGDKDRYSSNIECHLQETIVLGGWVEGGMEGSRKRAAPRLFSANHISCCLRICQTGNRGRIREAFVIVVNSSDGMSGEEIGWSMKSPVERLGAASNPISRELRLPTNTVATSNVREIQSNSC